MSSSSTGTSTQRPLRTARTAAGIGVVAASAALALAGCTSSGSSSTPSGSTSPTKSTQHIQSPVVQPTHPQNAIPADSSIIEIPALRKTILLTGCKAVSGGWQGTGTAKNTTSSTQTYHLLVFFTDKFSRTIDYARTDVTVAPGKTATWAAVRKFTPPKPTQCTLRGLYAGSAKHPGDGTSGSASPSKTKKK